jgi:hypothetical protein
VNIVPEAHELPAQAVSGTVPAALPFTQGVTKAGSDVALGTRATGNNVAKNGVVVAPTGGVSAERRPYEALAVQRVGRQAVGTVGSAAAIAPKPTIPAIPK